MLSSSSSAASASTGDINQNGKRQRALAAQQGLLREPDARPMRPRLNVDLMEDVDDLNETTTDEEVAPPGDGLHLRLGPPPNPANFPGGLAVVPYKLPAVKRGCRGLMYVTDRLDGTDDEGKACIIVVVNVLKAGKVMSRHNVRLVDPTAGFLMKGCFYNVSVEFKPAAADFGNWNMPIHGTIKKFSLLGSFMDIIDMVPQRQMTIKVDIKRALDDKDTVGRFHPPCAMDRDQ